MGRPVRTRRRGVSYCRGPVDRRRGPAPDRQFSDTRSESPGPARAASCSCAPCRHPNDATMRKRAWEVARSIYEAAGARTIHTRGPFPATHNMGTCRQSASSRDGVCNKYGQTHDVRNLFIADGSQFVNSTSENPTLTIVALAIRQADYISKKMVRREL